LIFLFAGYALIHNLPILGVLYCVDNAFFAFGLGISSYLGRMAPRADVTPTLAMGSTFNHIAAARCAAGWRLALEHGRLPGDLAWPARRPAWCRSLFPLAMPSALAAQPAG